MIEKGGLAKKMLAMDLLQRIALYPPTHRVLVASGVIEALLAQPKGIIPLALPKLTPKGWKAGKKVTGLEAQVRTCILGLFFLYNRSLLTLCAYLSGPNCSGSSRALLGLFCAP